MGQKVRPTGFRLGITDGWKSKWYASKKEFSTLLGEDLRLRKYILNKYQYSGIPRIEIERTRDQVIVHLHTARPGIIIGRKGADQLKREFGRHIIDTVELKAIKRLGFEHAKPIGDRVLSMFAAGEFDVRAEWEGSGVEGARRHGTAGERREGGGSHEPSRGRRHHDRDAGRFPDRRRPLEPAAARRRP